MVCKVQLGCNSQPVDLKCNLKRDRLPAFDVISPEMHTFSGLSSCPSIRRGVLTVAQPRLTARSCREAVQDAPLYCTRFLAR
jgi:hypothetical protein